MRDVEAVLAPEGEEEVVARDPRDLLRLEAEQLPDAVVLVDDEVARPQVGEGGERPAEAAVGARRSLAEDLRVGQEHEAELAPDEPAARRRDGEEELRLLGELLAGLEHPRVGALEEVLRAQRLTGVRKRDDDPVAAANEARELRLGLGEPARGDRGPLGLERERLPLRERVELGAALERDLLETLLRPDAPHLVRLPDEVGHAVEHRHEIARDLGRDPVVVRERRLGQLGTPLDGRVDHGALDRMKRPLRERRERSHLLDLVAVELDAERLAAGRREDVDEPAAHGELAALLGPIDPLVARERERLGEPVEARLGPDVEPHRLGPRRERRNALGERGRRGADEPAARQHVERARPFADEMRRRLEPGAPADTAPRQQRHALRADEPSRRLRRVARVARPPAADRRDRARAARAASRAEAAAPAPRRAPGPAMRPRTTAAARARAAP